MVAAAPAAVTSVQGSEFALVFAGDETYVLGLAVAMHSALGALSPAVRPEIFVLDNDLSESSHKRLLRVVDAAGRYDELHWIRIPGERLAHLASGGHLSLAAYSRLLIPTLLPPYIRRAIYVDADTLVREDLSALFEVDLDDSPIGAVRDFGIGGTDHQGSGVRDRRDARPYFNSGILVMDLARWRSAGLSDRALDYAAAQPEPLPYADQDALNAVVERWYELDLGWNVQHSHLFQDRVPPPTELSGRLYSQRWDVFRRAGVLHFIGGRKPWLAACTTPGTAAWVRALLRSGWYTRREAPVWLLDYLAQTARCWIGTKAHRSRAIIARSRIGDSKR